MNRSPKGNSSKKGRSSKKGHSSKKEHSSKKGHSSNRQPYRRRFYGLGQVVSKTAPTAVVVNR